MDNSNSNLIRLILDQAHTYAWEQDWEKAAAYYQQAIEISPDNPTILSNLGLAYFQLHEFEKSMKCYKDAARLSPKDPILWERLSQINAQQKNNKQAAKYALYAGDLHLKNQDIKKAIESWVQVTAYQPDEMFAHQRLALVYERLGQSQQSMREIILIAGLYQKFGEKEKAIDALKHGLEIHPEGQEIKKALTLIQSGGVLPAPDTTTDILLKKRERIQPVVANTIENIYHASTPIEDAHATAKMQLANFVLEVGASTEGTGEGTSGRSMKAMIKGAQQFISKKVDASLVSGFIGQALEHMVSENHEQAINQLEKAVEAGLVHPAMFFELGYLRYQQGRLESALRYFNKASGHPDYGFASRLLLGKIYCRMERPVEAFQEYMSALRIADINTIIPSQAKDVDMLYDPMIAALLKDTNIEEKQDIIQSVESLLLRQDWADYVGKIRDQIKNKTDNKQLVPLIEVIVENWGTNLIESLSRIDDLSRAGRIDSALEEAHYLLQYVPNYLPLHLTIGDLIIKQGKIDEGIDKMLLVGKVYEIRGEAERSLSIYHRIIDAIPMAVTVREQLIDYLSSIDNIEESLEECVELAEIYYSLADLEKAKMTYQMALKIANQSEKEIDWKHTIFKRLASIEAQCLNWSQALELYEESRQVKPDDQENWFKIIELNRRLGKPAEALGEARNYFTFLEKRGNMQELKSFVEALKREYSDWSELGELIQ